MNAFGLDITRAERPLFPTRRERRARYAVRVIGAGAVVVAVVGGGVAYAAWTSQANGSAGAKAGTVTFTVVSTTSGSGIQNTLRPGSVAGTASGTTVGGDLAVKLNNTSGFPVHVVSVAANGTITSDKAGCAGNHGVSVGTAGTYAVPVTTITVAGDAQDHEVVIPNALNMATTSDTSCQGATFTIPVTVTVAT